MQNVKVTYKWDENKQIFLVLVRRYFHCKHYHQNGFVKNLIDWLSFTYNCHTLCSGLYSIREETTVVFKTQTCGWQNWIVFPCSAIAVSISVGLPPNAAWPCLSQLSRFSPPSLTSSSFTKVLHPSFSPFFRPSFLPSLLIHFRTLANPKLCPLHLCSICGMTAEHWAMLYMPIQFCIDIVFVSAWWHHTKLKTIYWQVTELMSVLMMKALQVFCWNTCTYVTFAYVFLGLTSLRWSFPDTTYMSVLAWCQSQPVPRLFSLAEYGSAGERSRRAKKRNIGRYTWCIINRTLILEMW